MDGNDVFKDYQNGIGQEIPNEDVPYVNVQSNVGMNHSSGRRGSRILSKAFGAVFGYVIYPGFLFIGCFLLIYRLFY